MKRNFRRNPLRPLLALAALIRLVKRGSDSKTQIVIFLRALEGAFARRAFDRFKLSPAGPRILRERRGLIDTLMQAEAGDRHAIGTLGHAYHCHMRDHGFSVAALLDLATTSMDRDLPDDEALFQGRFRAMHDLMHVVTGYDGSVAGELCLLGFRVGQEWHLGYLLLTLGVLVKPPLPTTAAPVRRAMLEGYRLGKRAAWFAAADWEALLPMPLEAVRQSLGMGAPVLYHRIKASDGLSRKGGTSYDLDSTAAAT